MFSLVYLNVVLKAPGRAFSSFESSIELFCDVRLQMRDCCHGISSADLLYNRFGDDASCCPATCSVSREPCRYAQIHGSFTSTRHFKKQAHPH